MESGYTSPYFRPAAIIFCCVLTLLGVYIVISSILVSKNTSVISVTASKPTASISISQANKQAAIVGTGKVKLRLAPGAYQLVAIDAGSRTASVITVQKKHPAKVYLDLNKTSIVRSAANINFLNMDFLVGNGLSNTQIGQLEQYFFGFNDDANKVAVDPSSIKVISHDRNTGVFNLGFDVTVDNVPYKAVASYSNINSIHLNLFKPDTGAQVFDSSNLPEIDDVD